MLRIDTSALDFLINLWVGLALLLACAIFWAWALTRPLSDELTERDGGSGAPMAAWTND